MDLSGYPELLDPTCPWTPLREWGGLPNVAWCEAKVCGWVTEPANTWSNLADIAVGVWMLWATRGSTSRTERLWPITTLVLGTSAFVYHASLTFVLQVLDFMSLFLFFGLLVILNLIRLRVLPKERLLPVLLATVATLTALTVVLAKLDLPFQAIVLGLVIALLVTEAVARTRTPFSLTWFGVAIGLFAIAIAFSASDVSRARCDPHDHLLQGHAIWHVLGALSSAAAFRHYRQFTASFV